MTGQGGHKPSHHPQKNPKGNQMIELSHEDIDIAIKSAQKEMQEAKAKRSVIFTAAIHNGFSIEQIANSAGITKTEVETILEK